MPFIVLVILIGYAVLYSKLRSARADALRAEEEARGVLMQLRREYDALAAAYAEAHEELAVLSRYRPIVDVEGYVAQLRAQSQLDWNAAHTEIQRLEAKALSDRNDILGRAYDDARRIAGEALAAVAREKELKVTLRALENTINGYGLDYLTPTHAVLDELGSQYEFSRAGAELKAAIAKVKAMVRTGVAAQCDYVEEDRRLTAIAFAIDAFNGKVDTVLSSVKEDNYGTLEQKIRDAFQMVNHLGKAFRNARILQTYLDAQIDVLRWAARVHEIKVRERDEQRAMRERIREEAKAAKEYERAMREAAKDEETARRAVEKARADLEKAGDAQRARYEEKLLELTERLRQAEEKGQRALSMAQQTKAGHVYVISNVGSFGDDVLKIGMTRRLEPLDRVKELGDASVPFEFDVHAMIRSDDAPALERELQRAFLESQVNKINPRKEFFRIGLARVRAAVEERGLQTSWTMAAEAREWRESLALEEKLRNDAQARAEWERSQNAEMERAAVEDLRGGADEERDAAA